MSRPPPAALLAALVLALASPPRAGAAAPPDVAAAHEGLAGYRQRLRAARNWSYDAEVESRQVLNGGDPTFALARCLYDRRGDASAGVVVRWRDGTRKPLPTVEQWRSGEGFLGTDLYMHVFADAGTLVAYNLYDSAPDAAGQGVDRVVALFRGDSDSVVRHNVDMAILDSRPLLFYAAGSVDNLIDLFLDAGPDAATGDARRDRVDGRPCVAVSADTAGGRLTLWLDPAAGWVPRQARLERGGNDAFGDKVLWAFYNDREVRRTEAYRWSGFTDVGGVRVPGRFAAEIETRSPAFSEVRHYRGRAAAAAGDGAVPADARDYLWTTETIPDGTEVAIFESSDPEALPIPHEWDGSAVRRIVSGQTGGRHRGGRRRGGAGRKWFDGPNGPDRRRRGDGRRRRRGGRVAAPPNAHAHAHGGRMRPLPPLLVIAVLASCWVAPVPRAFGQGAGDGDLPRVPIRVSDDPIVSGSAGGGRAERAACGIHALYAAAQRLGRTDVRLADVLRPEYLSRTEGSSMAELVQCAADVGIPHRPVLRMSPADLYAGGGEPALLHVKARPWSEGYDHWVCLLSAGADGVVFYDPLDRVTKRVRWPDFASQWDGAAIVLGESNTSGPLRTLVGPSNVLTAATIALTCLALAAFGRLPPRTALGVVLLLAATYGVVAQAVTPWGLLGDPQATRHIDAWETNWAVEHVEQDQFRDLIRSGQVIVIDARDELAYEKGRIEGAVNYPAPVLRELVTFSITSDLEPDRPVVVYCSNDECDSAAYVARRLAWEGFDRVRVLRGGIEAWERLAEEETP